MKLDGVSSMREARFSCFEIVLAGDFIRPCVVEQLASVALGWS